jgi:hypothetical protein
MSLNLGLIKDDAIFVESQSYDTLGHVNRSQDSQSIHVWNSANHKEIMTITENHNHDDIYEYLSIDVIGG